MSEVTFVTGARYYVAPLNLPTGLVAAIQEHAHQTGQTYGQTLRDLAEDTICTEPALPLYTLSACSRKRINWLLPEKEPDRDALIGQFRRHGTHVNSLARCILLAAREKLGYQPSIPFNATSPEMVAPAGFVLPEALRLRRDGPWLWEALTRGLAQVDAEDVHMRIPGRTYKLQMPAIPDAVQPAVLAAANRLLLAPPYLLLAALIKGSSM